MYQVAEGLTVDADLLSSLKTGYSYSAESENKLVKSTENFAKMGIQIENKDKTWTVVRSYKNQFSCVEAVERLIKIHANTKEDIPCQTKK